MIDSSSKQDPGTKPETPGLEGDIQGLVDAATNLADAATKPVLRIIDSVSDSIGDEDKEPRISISNVADTGQSLINSSVRLAEKLATLAMDVVGPAADKAPSGQSRAVPSAVRGQELRLPMSIENPDDTEMVGLSFHVSELRGPTETSLSAASLKLEPESLTVAPRDFEKLVLLVDVPDDAAAGVYEGSLALENLPNFRVQFAFQVE